LKPEVNVATQKTPRKERAIQALRMGAAAGVDDLALADREPIAPVALVVDDEPQVRRFVSTVLRRQGWTVFEAADAAAALELANSREFDLLITDYEMPSGSGVSLAQRLRVHDRNLPVLVISGHPDVDTKVRDLRGRSAFARKPFAASELVARIGALVG
jgi:two-component system, OmpR family, KDP operon response regulator KdpE